MNTPTPMEFALLMALSTSLLAAPPARAFERAVALGQPFVSASADAHQGDYRAERAIDGYRDGASRWQVRDGGTLTLDTGALQAVQGLYVWTANSRQRSYWLRVQTSADGERWATQWRAIPTRRNSGAWPVYLPMSRDDTLMRYVRISGYGHDAGPQTRIAELRWLAAGEAPSAHPQVHRAHWFNHVDGRPDDTVDEADSGPYLVAWSDAPERYLSRETLDLALASERNCPLAGAAVFFPQAMAVDITGQADRFMTVKELPDTTIVYALDWSHAELDDPSASGVTGEPFAEEMFEIDRDQWQRRRAQGTTGDAFFTRIYHCDNANGDAYYSLPYAFADYRDALAGERARVDAGWGLPLPSPAPGGFSLPTSRGLPFARVVGAPGAFGSVRARAIDGFVDLDSRWSNREDGALELTTRPGASAAPPVRGLYLWTHRSNTRRNAVSIRARADNDFWFQVLGETALPKVPWDQPVFVPIEAGRHIDIHHIEVQGHGNENSDWSSIAELRYSDSATPPAGVVSIATSGAHPLGGKRFATAQVRRLMPESGGWSSSLHDARTTNAVEWVVDGDAGPLNYFAADKPITLVLNLDEVQSMAAINLWMHRSAERHSVIALRTYRNAWSFDGPDVRIERHTVPANPNHLAHRIALPAHTAVQRVEIDFAGNSLNDWNSIAEVSWE